MQETLTDDSFEDTEEENAKNGSIQENNIEDQISNVTYDAVSSKNSNEHSNEYFTNKSTKPKKPGEEMKLKIINAVKPRKVIYDSKLANKKGNNLLREQAYKEIAIELFNPSISSQENYCKFKTF